MVRHHVAQRAGRVVIAAAAADGERFRDRDLHMVDMVAIPDRLEQSVGEAQHHDVLHRLLAEIMVDAENLVFFENAEQLLIERARGGEIGAERLLDDDAPPGAVVFARQAGFAEMAADRGKARRRRRQIKQPVAFRAALALDAGKLLADLLVGRVVVGIALDIGDAAEQALDHALVDVARGEFRQAFGEIVGERFAREWTAGDADQGKCFRQQPGHGEIIERGHQQPVGEVARRAENNETARIGRPRRGGGGPRGVLGTVSGRHDALALRSVMTYFGSTCAPKPLRIAERIFSAKVWSRRERKRV